MVVAIMSNMRLHNELKPTGDVIVGLPFFQTKELLM